MNAQEKVLLYLCFSGIRCICRVYRCFPFVGIDILFNNILRISSCEIRLYMVIVAI